MRDEKLSLSYELNLRNGRATSTMSYEDRIMVVRCHTILNEVLRCHAIIDEVIRRRRMAIAQILCDEPRRRTMSCDVVRHRTIILRYPT